MTAEQQAPEVASHAPDRNLALERSRSGTIRSIASEHQLWKFRAYASVNFG